MVGNNQYKNPWTEEEIEKLKSTWSNIWLSSGDIKKLFPKKTLRAIRHKASRLNLRRRVCRVNRPIIKDSSYLAYIIGVLLGDGYLQKARGRYKIELTCKEPKFIRSFAHALRKIGLNPQISLPPSVIKRGCIRVTAWSALFYKWFKSLKKEQLEKIVLAYPTYFLKGFYESEGHKEKYVIYICNTDLEKINLAKKCLSKIGIDSVLYCYSRSGYKDEIRLAIYRKKQIEKFFRLIKPCIKN
jgi:intein-encoded DNA endonuclease-like protein